MSRAGAHVVGVNCHFDPFVSLEAVARMKAALEEKGLLEKPTYLMCQPLAYHTPDAGKQVMGNLLNIVAFPPILQLFFISFSHPFSFFCAFSPSRSFSRFHYSRLKSKLILATSRFPLLLSNIS